MSQREKREQRKRWKKNSKTYREKKKSLANTLNDTPPESENGNICSPHSLSHKKAGRKIVRKDRAKAYRTIKKKNDQIKRLQQTVDRLRKKSERSKGSVQRTSSTASNNNGTDLTPNAKTNELLKNCEVPPEVRKKLLFNEVMSKQLEQTARNLPKNSKDREAFQKCVSGDFLKKYRLQHMAKRFLSKNRSTKNILKSDRKRPTIVVSRSVRQKITDFYESDDVSRMCPGKKDYVIKGKMKKQKRILLDNITDLHFKFVEETTIKISYATFLREKPFWVLAPSWRDRDTCLCVKHENFNFMVTKLNRLKQVTARSTSELIKQYSCDLTSYKCMFGECLKCKSIDTISGDSDLDTIISYWQWQSQQETRIVRGENKIIRMTNKVMISSSIKDLKTALGAAIPEMKKHLYGIHANNKEKKGTKENLKANEIMMQIDFSENYVTKYAQEIQSVHFGASKAQLSLHTGVYYTKDDNMDTIQTHSFATVSENLEHQAHAVWAHLKPVLMKILNNRPGVDTLHIFSDGPTSQYRNRNNIHLWLQTIMYQSQISTATWIFSEPGHGKGPMDGIGGVLKRTADSHVRMGKDVRTATNFVNLFLKSTVDVVQISSCDIETIKNSIPENVDAIPGIMGVTKISWAKAAGCVVQLFQNEVFLKQVSLKALEAGQNDELETTSLASSTCLDGIEQLPDELLQPPDESLLNKQRQSFYNAVYGSSSSSDGEEANTNNLHHQKENLLLKSIHPGLFLLVEVPTLSKNKYTYVALVNTTVDDDGEVNVTFLKSTGTDANIFAIDDEDVSYISFDQIIKILPEPKLKLKGSRQYYCFTDKIEIFEK